ncbi:hypothetical protein TNCV_3390591 [Trichonephila clavipes]|nr:hypothetical protein TNCV_3390591 [Trichonephila clavipes]
MSYKVPEGTIEILGQWEKIGKPYGIALLGSILSAFPRFNCVGQLNYGIDLEFAEQKNGLIRERIVLGVKDSELQKRLHGENNLGLEKATEIVREAEVSREPIRNMKHETATRNPMEMRLYLDPRDLKKVVKGEHYQIPCANGIISRVEGNQMFLADTLFSAISVSDTMSGDPKEMLNIVHTNSKHLPLSKKRLAQFKKKTELYSKLQIVFKCIKEE